MSFELILFYLFAGVTLAAAVGVVTVRNSVYAVLCLILAFFSSAALWILLQAEFLGIVLVLVYVGAVMVLFLFVIMMLDISKEMLAERFVRYVPFALVVAVTIAVEMILVLQRGRFSNAALYEQKPLPENDSNTEALGELLYTHYLYPFEIAAVILLVAMVAAIVLTLRHPDDVKKQQVSQQVRTQASQQVRLVEMKSEEQS